MHLVFWGTYDTGKPRVRILMRGLRENGVVVTECHADVWRGVEDKSQLAGKRRMLGIMFRWFASYPSLIVRYLRLPRHDAVVVSYLGHVDVVVLWAFAKLRGVPVVWDAFLSLHDTVVNDRKMVGPRSAFARALHLWERLACRSADLVLLDTHAHADYFATEFNISEGKIGAVFVGAEPDVFFPAPAASAGNSNVTVLFYGQFIPLHGIEIIVRAAVLLKDEPINWLLIGKGQEADRIRALIAAEPLPRLQWIEWIPYADLIRYMHQAAVCLGIFGGSDKAARVIPNKVFQVVSTEKQLITRDSPAMRELFRSPVPEVWLVPAMDAEALADAVRQAVRAPARETVSAEYREARERIQPYSIGHTFVQYVAGLKTLPSEAP